MKKKLFSLLLAVAAGVGINAKVIDLTAVATSIDEWTPGAQATLNESASVTEKGKYVYDIAGGEDPNETVIKNETSLVFQTKNSHTKSKAFVIYPGKCFEYGGKNGILVIKNTAAGDAIKLTVAARGSIAANFLDGAGTFPENAIAVSTDLTLPAKGSEGADEDGYVWKVLEFMAIGGDVQIKEFDGGYRIRSIVVGSPNHGTCGDNLTWNLTGGVLTISGTGAMNDYSVTSVPWYYYRSSITSVIVENGVTSIGNYAFSYCSGLTSITILNSVTSIGDYAFEGCTGLTSIDIPNSVTSIGDFAFENCSSLTSISVATDNPNYSSKDGVLFDKQQTKLVQYPGGKQGAYVIPNSVTGIGFAAFLGCSSLTSVTIPNSVTSIGEWAFSYCSSLTSVTIPNSVTSIGEGAFIGCSSLTSVTIPNSVTSIGDKAFRDCSSLTSVTIPNSVTSIGWGAFQYCSSLTSVTIPNSVTSIGQYAFSGCSSLTSIYVPCGEMERFKQMLNNDSRINDHAPLPYTITISATNGNVIYPQTICDDMLLNAIPDYGYHFVKWSDGNTDNPREFVLTQDTTFAAEFAVDKSGVCGDDNLLTWTFEDESKTLAISGEGTLNSNYNFGVEAPTQTERLIIAEGVTSVGNNAFKDMSSTITSLALPSTVTEIGDYAFAGMNNRKFNTLVLPNTIIRIGAHAFDGASYLQTIHFGSTLEEIGDYAFNGCTRVKQMTCLAEITPNVGTDGLTSINSLAELYVPNEYLFDYQIDSNWSRFVLKPYGATETTVTDNDVAVVADDNTATFTWPTSNTADSYTIDITKDGVLFCQLTFNANGQLTGIAFAPGRDGQSMAPAAVMTANGLQFTVTGLNSNTQYGYSLTAKDANEQPIATYSGNFTTTSEGVPTGIDNTAVEQKITKILRNGEVLILRDGKTYTIQGVEVK